METWQSWTIFGLATAGAAYYYTTSSGQRKRGIAGKASAPQAATRRTPSKSRDKRKKEREADGQDPFVDSPASGSESNKRSGLKASRAQDTRREVENGRSDAGDNEGMSNTEFAKQLSDRITGTSLKKEDATPSKSSQKKARRAEEQARAHNNDKPKLNGGANGQQASAASSMTGAEADDDLSPANSPELGATNVSDMLETSNKPSGVLRLAEPEKPLVQRSPKAQKPAQEPESKKQRQNRRKKEEQKAMREQADQERHRLLENQRRTAREAEGRPAKNGLGNASAPPQNAWASSTKAGGNNDSMATRPSQLPLLDTFEESTSSSQAHQSATSSEAPSSVEHYGGLPSEEEQIKLLNEIENDNAWSTVPKGGKAKQKASSNSLKASTGDATPSTNGAGIRHTNGESVFPKGAPGTALNGQANGTLPLSWRDEGSVTSGRTSKQNIDRAVWNHANIHEHPLYDPAYPYALTGHPDDSDWAVV